MLEVRWKSSLFGVGRLEISGKTVMSRGLSHHGWQLYLEMTILPFKFINMSGLDITSKCEDDQDDEAGGECVSVTVCYSVLQCHSVSVTTVTSHTEAHHDSDSVKLARLRLSWIPRSWVQTRAVFVTSWATLLVNTRLGSDPLGNNMETNCFGL